MEGVKVTSVFAGMKKNYLSPNEPLKDEAKSELQKEVDRLYGMFVQHISKNRGLTEKQVIDTQAGIFHGEEAILSGLADEISNMDEALERIQMETEENKKGESQTVEEEVEKIELSEKETDSITDYKSEVLEIAKLCALSKSNRFSEFIEKGYNADAVKQELLHEISKHIAQISNINSNGFCMEENPLIKEAKSRCR